MWQYRDGKYILQQWSFVRSSHGIFWGDKGVFYSTLGLSYSTLGHRSVSFNFRSKMFAHGPTVFWIKLSQTPASEEKFKTPSSNAWAEDCLQGNMIGWKAEFWTQCTFLSFEWDLYLSETQLLCLKMLEMFYLTKVLVGAHKNGLSSSCLKVRELKTSLLFQD